MPHIKTLFSDQSTIHPLKHGVTKIGRALDSDIRISLQVVSKQHAVLTYTSEGCMLENLSSNNTYVNGKKLLAPVRLQNGDRIQIATALMMFLDYDPEEDESSRYISHLEPVRTILSPEQDDPEASLRRTAIPFRSESRRVSVSHQCDIEPHKIRSSVLMTEQSIVTLLSDESAKPVSQALQLLKVLEAAHDSAGCDAVAEHLRRCFPPANEVVVLLCDGPNSSELSVWGTSELQGQNFVICADVVHRVVKQSECLLISDLWRETGCEKPALLRMGQISLMCVPIRSADGCCRGVVQVLAGNPNPDFEAGDLGRLAFLAQMLTMVIGPARVGSAAK